MSRELLRRRVARVVRRALLMLAAVVATQLLGAASVQAVDDYTLPFYDRDVTLLYGVDRDPRASIQLDYTGKTWFDADPHPGRVYDNHTGLDYPMPLRSPVAAAKDGVVADTEGGYGTQQFGNFGNFVRVRHDDGRHTLYYHLASRGDGGIAVAFNEDVVFGEQVGLSGCSGSLLRAAPAFRGPARVGQVPAHQRPDVQPPVDDLARSCAVCGQLPPARAMAAPRPFGRAARSRTGSSSATSAAGRGGRTLAGTHRARYLEAAAARQPVRGIRLDQQLAGHTRRAERRGSGRDRPLLVRDPRRRATGQLRRDFNLLSHGVHWFDHNLLGGFHVPIIVSNLSE